MVIFEITSVSKDIRDGEEGLILFGRSLDHYTPMKIINDFLGENVLRICGGGLMVHLFLPEKHMQLWSDKLGTHPEFWQGKNIILSKLQTKGE